MFVSAQTPRLGKSEPARSPLPDYAGRTAPALSWLSLCPCDRSFPSTHRLSSSFTEKNCSYFRHFNPGESSEIFEVTTQKGEPVMESRGGRKSALRHTPLGQKIIWHKSPDFRALD